MSQLLRMTNIKKSFGGVQALKNGRLELEKGEIHGLIGENGAGKSTLMKILLGVHAMDSGEIEFKGQPVKFKNPSEALRSGISMIHQEVSLVPQMSVMENIWLGQEKRFSSLGQLNQEKMRIATRELLDKLQVEIDPGQRVASLSIAEMQLVELARAVSYNSDLIIMDEPTSALTNKEIDLMFSIMRRLASEGISIIFISHKLEELLSICHNVTTMRDGEYIATSPSADMTKEELIRLIVGRDNVETFKRTQCEIGDTILEVNNLTSEGVFNDISFSVRKGEIVGFAGLMGAGRTEIMRAIFGADPYSSGEVRINGAPLKIKEPKHAIRHGIGMVQEDRLRCGSIYSMSVMENATLADLRNLCNRFAKINSKKEKQKFDKIAEDLMLKYSSPNASIKSLSGGNQQKVIFARWQMLDIQLLILDEPTRGIDVGAKAEIYRLIDYLVSQGMAVIMVSSELPEILSLCDRVIVIRNGGIAAEYGKEEATQERIMQSAFGL